MSGPQLRHLEKGNVAWHRVAERYGELLAGLPLILPQARPGAEDVYYLYAIQTEQRDALRTYLTERGIGSAMGRVVCPSPNSWPNAFSHCLYIRGSRIST